jgi:hypothetical protein
MDCLREEGMDKVPLPMLKKNGSINDLDFDRILQEVEELNNHEQ